MKKITKPDISGPSKKFSKNTSFQKMNEQQKKLEKELWR
jgi:hypothetical protein